MKTAPARARDIYVKGKAASYEVPTVARVDVALRKLALKIRRTEVASVERSLRHDADLLLDRRTELALAEATAEAIRIARGE